MIDSFLLGVIATASLTAGLFFLKFWRDTRDSFFLAFAASFLIEALNRISLLFVPRPHEGNPWIYLVRLFAFLLILVAIIRKNYGRN
jgi:hypothetical protein